MLNVVIPGPAVPFARPRFGAHGGFNETEYAAWKAMAARTIRLHCRKERIEAIPRQPLAAEITLYRPRPVKAPEGIAAADWRAGGAFPAIGRSDLDNHCKAALDALVDSGIIADDRLIVHLVAWSYYTPAKVEPALWLAIMAVNR